MSSTINELPGILKMGHYETNVTGAAAASGMTIEEKNIVKSTSNFMAIRKSKDEGTTLKCRGRKATVHESRIRHP